jgi:hypothetical protein
VVAFLAGTALAILVAGSRLAYGPTFWQDLGEEGRCGRMTARVQELT